MALRIVADENIELTPALQQLAATLVRLPGREIQRQDLLEADVLLVRSVTPVDRSLLEGTPVNFVGSATAGVDHIDCDHLTAKGVRFCASPGSNANAVVEYVMSVITRCGILRNLMAGEGAGIIGYGHIGRRLASLLQTLGANVWVWDPWCDVPENMRSPSLSHALSQSTISLHASLHNRAPWPSKAMIDVAAFTADALPRLFINAARGELVTASALDYLLENEVQVALDVWPDEPAIAAPLLTRVACGTPHIAGYSYEAKAAATDALAAAIAAHWSLPVSPVPVQPTNAAKLELSVEGMDPVDCLGALFSAAYDPITDYRQLCLHDHEGVTPDKFDQLRREYPMRRELRGQSVVLCGSLKSSSMTAIFDALGVNAV